MAENTYTGQNEDPKYRKKVYDILSSNFEDFKLSESDFYKKLDSDTGYAPKVYKVLKDNFSDFQKPEKDFMSLVGPSKKKGLFGEITTYVGQLQKEAGEALGGVKKGLETVAATAAHYERKVPRISGPVEEKVKVEVEEKLDPNDLVGSLQKTMPPLFKQTVPTSDATYIRPNAVNIFNEQERQRPEVIKGLEREKKLKDLKAAFTSDVNLSTTQLMRATGRSANEIQGASREELAQMVREGNQSDRLAAQTVADARDIRQAFTESENLEQAAIKLAALKDPQVARQIEITASKLPARNLGEVVSGTRNVMGDPKSLFGEATLGRMIYQLASNPVAVQEIEKNPELKKQFREAIPLLINKYPSFGKSYLGNVISQKMEDMGMNNALLNIVTKEETDKVVDELVSEGKMSPLEIQFYKDNMREGGIRNFAKTIIGEQLYKTPGLIERTAESAVSAIKSTGAGAAEVTGLRPLLVGERAMVARDVAARDEAVNIRPRGTINEISAFGGDFLGQVLPTGLLGKGLTAAKVFQNPDNAIKALFGLQAFGNYMPQARAMFPGEGLKQRAYAGILAGLELATENIFRDKKVIDGLLGKVKPEIASVINKFTAKEISAATAREAVEGTIAKAIRSVPQFTKYFAKGVGENTFEETVTQLGQQLTDGVFTGKKFNDWVNGEELLETARTSALGSTFIAGLSARADMLASKGMTAKMVYDMAEKPEYWIEKIRENAETDPDLQADAEDKIANLEYATKVRQDLEKTNLTEKQKIKFLINALDAHVKGKTSQSITDPVLKKRAEQEAKVVEQQQEAILNGDDQGEIEGDLSDEVVEPAGEVAPEVPAAPKEITEQEYSDFIDKGIVIPERLNDIAQKVKNQEKLSEREQEIFTDKTADINKIIAEEVKPEVPQTVKQLRAAEQAEYAAMADPNDEIKRQEIYDKYDKLITPLLEKEKEVPAAPTEGVGAKPQVRSNTDGGKYVKYNPDDVLPLLKDFEPTNTLEVENYVTQVVPSDASVEAYKMVPVDNIKPSEKLSEKDRAEIDRIKDAIKNNEDIPPVVLEFAPVIDNNSEYKFGLADGHHRYIAYKELGYNEIPSAIITSREDYTFNTNDKDVSTLFKKVVPSGVTPQAPAQAPVPSIIEVKSPKEVKQGDTVVWRGEEFVVDAVNNKGGFNLRNKKEPTWTVTDARITDEEFQGKRGEAVPEAKLEVETAPEIPAAAPVPSVQTEQVGYTSKNLPKPIGNFEVVEVIPYTEVDKNKFKPEQQLKFNQGDYYEPVRIVGDSDLIELIQMGSRLINNLKAGYEKKPINKYRKEKLEKQFGITSYEAYNKARQLAKDNRGNIENIIIIGEPVSEIKSEVPAKTTSDVVADDLLNFLGIKPEGGEVKFSKRTGQPEVIKPVDEKEKEVIDQMNAMELVNEGVELGAPSTTNEKIDVDELNSRLDTPLAKVNWDDYEGIPFAFTISDQLRSGDVTNPATGEVIGDLKGGIGFNGTSGNEGNSWANTSKDEAEALLSKALDVYNANKPLFEKLWAEGKLPDGHTPVAVVKMAESSILSNEAVFRVGIQNIKTLPERNRQKAVTVLTKTLKQKAAQISKDIKRGADAKTGAPYSENTLKAKKKLLAQYNRILDVVNKYGYKDIVEVLEDSKHFSLPEKAIITGEVFYGAPTPIGTKPIDINRSRPSTPVSVALIGNKNPELINIGRITDLLTEPSMKNVPNMHVVSIVGVDVKNPQTTETNHPNYKFGVKGQSIGVLENPVHMKDAFGEAYGSAISQVTKNEASNASINAKQAMTQGIPVQAGLPNRVLKGAVAKKNLDAIDKLTGFLRQAFPSTTFFSSQEAWDAAMADPSIKKKLKQGEVVYAFTTDGNVFINPNLKTTKAALHETGHIWMEFVRDSNPEIYKKGLSLVEGTKELEKAKEQYGDTELAREEALMELMSSKGDTIVNASQKAKFKEWLLSLYKYISESFTSLLGLSPKEVENLTLDKFIEGMLADILSGREVTSKKVKTQLKLSAESKYETIKRFIDLQRQKGFSDEDIRAGIKKVAKSIFLSESDVDNLMAGEIPIKTKEDAVQEQAAGKVPVQPEAGVSKEVEGGVPGAKPKAAPEEGKAEGEEEKVRVSGIKKGLVSQEVLSRVNLNTVGDKELLESGRAIIESGEVKPKTVVNRVIDGGQGVLTPAEVVAMITYKADLDTKQEDFSKEIERRTKAGEDLGDLLVEYKDLQVEIDNYDIAAVITAQQQSLAFRLRRYLLDREYNISVQINRYKQTNGGTIPESVLAKFNKLNETIKDLRKKIKEAEAVKYEEDSKAAMQNIIEDVERENQANGPKLYTEQELEDKVKEGVQKEIDGIYAKMPAEKKSKAQRVVDALDNIQRKLRSKTYDASLGVPVAFIDAGITAIKNAIKLGIEVEKAIEIGIKTIKDKLNGAKWDKEADFRKDMMEGFKEEGVDVKKTKEVKAKINDDGTITIPNKDIRDFVSQGIEDIDDLADAILNKYQAELPGISSRQVRDAITKYGKEVSQTRDDISIKLGRAKRVGRLLSELEDLRTMDKGAFLLKYQRVKPAQDKISEREKNLKYLIRQLGREIMGDEPLPDNYDEQKALDTAKNRVGRRIEELRDKVRRGDFSKKQKRRVQADQELLDLQTQLENAKSQFDLEHEKNEQKNKKWYQKAGDFVLELFSGIPRTLVTGFDLGIVFTQGIRKVFTNPRMSAKAFVEAGKQFFSESRQRRMEQELKLSGSYALIKNSGLAISEGAEKASAQEQIFIVNYVNLIWDTFSRVITLNYKPGTDFVKALNPFKASQRFFDGYLNYIRINSFLDLSNAIDKGGYMPETHPEIYKAAAEFVNTTTGKGAKNIPKSLGFLMFSASKVASELKLYTPYAFYYYAKMPKAVRKRAMLEFGTFALSFGTTMFLMRAALGQGQGGEDDDEFWDINSSNFLTFKFGNQRVSFAAGARPTLVFMGRLFSGVYVDQYGQESKLGERTGKQINTRFDLIVRFFTAKAAPVPAAVIQYLDKKAGVEVEDNVFQNLVLPMWLQDSQELYAQNPKEIGALYTLLSLIGANIRTVEEYTQKEHKVPKKIIYKEQILPSGTREREVTLTDEQRAEFQKIFDQKFKENIDNIHKSEAYKKLKGKNDRMLFDVTFGKKAKDDAETDAINLLERIYTSEFKKFPIIRETPEEKEINRILNIGEKR